MGKKSSWTNRRFRGLYERGIEQTGEARSAAEDLRKRGRSEFGKAVKGQDELAGQLKEDVGARRGLVQRLESQSKGEGPSLAEAQMRQSQDRSLAQQLAAAGRTRGASGAATQRALMRNQQAAARDIAQQSAVTRMQEQQAAQQQLGQLASQSQQQLGAQLAQRQAIGSQQDLAAQQLQRAINQQQFEAQMQAVSGRGAHSQGGKSLQLQRRGQDIGLAGSLIGSAGTVGAAMLSDEDKKKAIKESKSYSDKDKKKEKESMDSKDFLSKLKAYKYEYKNPEQKGAGKGEHFSVMAQDLEKAGKIGKAMVKNTEHGKMVDYGKGFGSILAAQVQLNERLKKLEEKKKK